MKPTPCIPHLSLPPENQLYAASKAKDSPKENRKS
jgi:hypothetical protein